MLKLNERALFWPLKLSFSGPSRSCPNPPPRGKYSLIFRFGFSEPDRGDLENEEIEWRHGKPDYTMANYQYLR